MKLHTRRIEFFGILGDKHIASAAIALALALFCLPALTMGQPLYTATQPDDLASEQGASLPIHRTATLTASRDKGRAVRLLQRDGTVVKLTMAEYLWGVVAAEMPASFEPEAIKAQACAARTYTVLKQDTASQKHPDADICADSTCCQAYTDRAAAQARWGANATEYTQKIEQALAQTDGLGILYEEKPIQALFFSSAAGKTVDAVEVWGNSVDYLKSVDSIEGEGVPNYQTQVTLTTAQFKDAVTAAYPAADLSGDASAWITVNRRTEGGCVGSVLLGGLTLTGAQVRTLFSLRSATFSVSYDEDCFTFDVTGYGHGVGMSQYGANAMAKQGSDFQEILTWYYSGTEVAPLW